MGKKILNMLFVFFCQTPKPSVFDILSCAVNFKDLFSYSKPMLNVDTQT